MKLNIWTYFYGLATAVYAALTVLAVADNEDAFTVASNLAVTFLFAGLTALSAYTDKARCRCRKDKVSPWTEAQRVQEAEARRKQGL